MKRYISGTISYEVKIYEPQYQPTHRVNCPQCFQEHFTARPKVCWDDQNTTQITRQTHWQKWRT